MEIFTFGNGRRLEVCKDYLSKLSLGKERLILLPIPTTRDTLHVKGTTTLLSDIYPLCKAGTVVCGYGIPKEARLSFEERGALVIDGLLDEDFLCENATLTVYGALGEILSSFEAAPSELSIGIVGYGRIGKRLLSSLLFLGARVKLYTRSEEVRLTLGREGVESEIFSEGSDYSGLDLLINTAPTRVLCEERMRGYEDAGLKILDLASGECFPPSPSVKKLASIPERSYPVSAGRLYGKFIMGQLGEKK